tara:strand:- start:5528 stop:6229 length:702 start_codon:yes stop_codon:yes gene_type:complete
LKVVVIQFPGSNCDYDTVYTLKQMEDVTVDLLWHKASNLQNYDLIILPGGFSYGDFLRAGSIASHSPIMKYVKQAAESDIAILGICNGFQILTEMNLLPGILLKNSSLMFICDWINLKVNNNNTMFSDLIDKTSILRMPIAHNEGRYYINELELKDLIKNNQIIFQYVDDKGNTTKNSNPNGSIYNIAAICNKKRNIMGIMPHPERASDKILSPYNTDDGLLIFKSIINYLRN